MASWYRLGIAVGITALLGCGNPAPDQSTSGTTTGSADAVVSPPAGDTSRVSSVANEPARQAPTQTFPLGPPAQQASKPDALIANDPRATSPARDTSAQTATSLSDRPPHDEKATAEQAQREARQLWFAEAREHPDVGVRLQALELWAQQPGDAVDPVTYALVDEDEQVRTRAQELWEQQLTQEAGATQPIPEEGTKRPAE